MTDDTQHLKRAVLWEKSKADRVQCYLCAFRCNIAEGAFGNCLVRKNIDGTLYSLNYDKVCAGNIDPIEKKPLFHFQPGSKSFSVACIGCNFKCEFCQNWQISQAAISTGTIQGEPLAPDIIVKTAIRRGCTSIAYTYTEPTIFMELCEETGKIAKKNGIKNVFVSNGYMTPQAIDFSRDWLDGINVDLKAYSDDFYKNICKARLKPVLDAIKYIGNNTDIWMEITTLVVPGQNDSEQQLRDIASFIADEVGPDVPWHVSRFYPQYHMDGCEPTPIETIARAVEIGKEAGLRYIYPGNIPGSRAESTFCYSCGKMLIERLGYVLASNEIQDGKCPKCKTTIAGFEL